MDTYLENQERHVLIINTGERRAYALEAAAYSIGRDTSNAIVLEFDTVSRQHALLLRVPNPTTQRYEYRIVDGNAEGKASANGVFINGKQIKSATLKNGDSVEFGQHIQAAYLTLSMGEAEFVNYLESISYQSLKRELVNCKATMVGTGFDEMFLDTPTTLTARITKPEKAETNNYKDAKWLQTIHDDDKVPVDSSHEDFSPDNLTNAPSNQSKKTPIKLWMALAGGLLVIALAVGGILLTKKPVEKSVPSASSGTELQNSR